MTDIVYATLGDAGPLRQLFGEGEGVRAIAVPESEGVDALRSRVRAALQHGDTFVLAVPSWKSSGAQRDPSRADVVRVLRAAFGLCTGAATCPEVRIVLMLPSAALLPDETTRGAVLLRSLLGMAEALRAELRAETGQVGILFHVEGEDRPSLAARVQDLARSGRMYGMSADLTVDRIESYFTPLRAAIAAAPAGPTLPDIGPMAEVYVRAGEERIPVSGASEGPRTTRRSSR